MVHFGIGILGTVAKSRSSGIWQDLNSGFAIHHLCDLRSLENSRTRFPWLENGIIIVLTQKAMVRIKEVYVNEICRICLAYIIMKALKIYGRSICMEMESCL